MDLSKGKVFKHIFCFAYLMSNKGVNGKRQYFNFERLICDFFDYVIFMS